MGQKTDSNLLIERLDYYEEDIRQASLTFSINLFTNVLLTDIPDVVLHCQKMFFELCPQERIKFYATENMRKHRPVTKRVFGMLETWFRNPESKTEYIVLELKDGDSFQCAPKYLFKVIGNEKDSIGYSENLPNLISFAFPPVFGVERGNEMLDLVTKICDMFPFQSGSAGYAFQCSRYTPQLGESFAWKKSMRYPEIDIVRLPQDIHAVGQNAIKTVGWLTFVNSDFLKKLGGITKIKESVGSDTRVFKTKNGYIFKIGDLPVISDRNRGESSPDYQKLYQNFKPLIDIASQQSLWFDTGGRDEGEQTEAWYRRLENV